MRLALATFASAVVVALSGCATDLIMDLGKGDSIRLVGQAESFDCDDPKYANVDKVRTTQLRFADGDSMWLCMARKDLPAQQQATFESSVPQDPAAPVVHAIGISYAPQSRVVVNVLDNSRPLILALSAYNRVRWSLTMADGVAIQKIILSGYHAQTITGMLQDVPVEVYTYDPSPCAQCVRGSGYFYDFRKPHKRIEELAGQAVNTFQGGYAGERFTITTPR